MSNLKDFIVVKKENEGFKVLVWILAIVGVVVAIAGIAYAVYRYVNRDYLEDFEDEFEDEFEDDFVEECFEESEV